MPRPQGGPGRAIAQRLTLAALILLGTVVVVYLGRDGYADNQGSPLSLLDAAYYATVSLSTTGYGDIAPITPSARLVNVLVITPARVIFLILLVGTTLEVLTERSREAIRVGRWRRRVDQHVVVVGYGVKGRSAVRALRADGVPADQIVVVDPDQHALAEAGRDGLTTVVGSGTRTAVLREALTERARAVIISTDSDEANVLITLTVRDLAPNAVVVAAVREAENIPLLRRGGADQVVTSSDAAGRMLGLATRSPRVVDVFEDLLTSEVGLRLTERAAAEQEVGRGPRECLDPVLALVRAGRLIRYDEPEAAPIRRGDRLITVRDVGDHPDPGGTG
ncbi:voltage-gated potassium channel [Parafrankia irregularis]|uniref:Voltage-gated potassium channel n=1 Tax=Parafrankia irregularis TaxID=795642 RepID=A0A0S4QIV3_9ACTN|nr:potassium channel protein [Parafrankia irregularis]MBE3205621.1 NAD-binding protein [Parafrankia sp. CH37]CUU55479.1 voltage-gated potassium channel [Parafrankia irregularis]